MPTSLEHGPKYKCRKVNRGRHALETMTNGTKYDIPNTDHLREEEGRGLKEYITKGKKLNPRPIDCSRSAHVCMLTSSPLLLVPRRSCPSSMCPRSICIHAKAQTRKLVDKQWKDNAQVLAEG